MPETYESIAKDAQEKMSRFLNVMATSNKDFIEAMGRDHRYLQGQFTELCFAWLKSQAERLDNGLYDGRNKFSVEKCSEIVRKVDLMGPPDLSKVSA